jgi:hypothetical protein
MPQFYPEIQNKESSMFYISYRGLPARAARREDSSLGLEIASAAPKPCTQESEPGSTRSARL